MSSLTDIEKRYFEKLLGMGSGYVLDFSDATFGEFFRRYEVDIHGHKYQTFGTSKAKKLRAFWESEPDQLVGAVLSEMLDSYEADCELNGRDVDGRVLERTREIVGRISGRPVVRNAVEKESEFLEREFSSPSIHKLPIDPQVTPIIKARLEEARAALAAGAHLSVIFLCGSVLEAVLLGAAQQSPRTLQSDEGDTERCRWVAQALSRMEPRPTDRCRVRGWRTEARRQEVQSRIARLSKLHPPLSAIGLGFHAGRTYRQALLAGS